MTSPEAAPARISHFASPRKRLAFWLGTAAITVGVVLHLPMFVMSASMHYVEAGMPMGPEMYAGMTLIVAGLFAAAYSLWPAPLDPRHHVEGLRIAALDRVKFSRAHLVLVIALVVALVIDIMKPASLGFVVPGSGREYHLARSVVALFPFSALVGTTLGSFLWGWLGDRIGRRASILLSAMFFVGTAICGTMPAFQWNVFMCFLMGMAAGGMLPIAFALLSEFMPARNRGATIVLVGALGAIGGYVAASTAATFLEPIFGWRIMWLLNLPTGLILVLLNRWIPESPRFLILHDRTAQAAAILRQFGARVVSADNEDAILARERAVRRGFKTLIGPAYIRQSAAVTLYGLAYGLVNFGFLLWLPSNLRSMGMSITASNALIAKSALFAFPGALLVMWLYGWWSTRWSLVLLAGLTSAAMLALAFFGPVLATNGLVLSGLILAVIMFSSGMTSLLGPYCAEVFPTRLRATSSGISAGSSKGGGIVGQLATIAHVTPALAASALLIAAPVLLAAVVLAGVGLETRDLDLDATSLKRVPVTE